MSKHFLSVVAIFRNEAHALREWIEHYLAEGADHFYLIDNTSTDGYLDVLNPYIERGQVTLTHEGRRHIQRQVYNWHVLEKNESEWFAVVDLDEFIFAREGTVADFLRVHLHQGPVNNVRLSWVEYGSSGRIWQPESIIGGFLMRRVYEKTTRIPTKNIVRSRDLYAFDVHAHAINGWVCVDGCLQSVENSHGTETDEEYIRRTGLLLNHYRVQSREFFYKVKMTRGDCADGHKDEMRDDRNFTSTDFNDILDDTLARKRGLVDKDGKEVERRVCRVEIVAPCPELLRPNAPKYYLAITAIFKNEADNLKEWLDHYIAEGVEHFYLIENNSSDNWQQVLEPYRERGLVTLFIETGEQAQIRAYEEYIRPIREAEWVIVVDLDEFLYARQGAITDFLVGLPEEVGYVQVPWIMFGSSGYDWQPDGVVRNFLWRKAYYGGFWELNKGIVRMRKVKKLEIHDHEFERGTLTVDGAGNFVEMKGGSFVDEGTLAQTTLVLNHYKIQSNRRFMRVKTGRGDAVFADNYRGQGSYDATAMMCGMVLDKSLANKRAREAVPA